MVFVVVWTFAELLIGLVLFKWFVTEVMIEKFRVLRKMKRHGDLDGFDILDALAYGPIALFSFLGWTGGSIYGVFSYPAEGWYVVSFFSCFGAAFGVVLAAAIPFVTYWAVVWAWRGLMYLLPERLHKSR